MSNEVLNSVPGRSSSDALLDIERYDCIPSSVANFAYYQGPFGVLRLPDDPPPDHEMEIEEPILSWDDCLAEMDEDANPEEIDLDLLAEIFDFPHQLKDHDQTASTQFCDLPLNTDDIQTDTIFSQSESLISYCPTEFPDNFEAWSILSHYKERIVPLVSPLGFGQEASWLNLVMPCAVSTLGELTTNQSLGHPKLALLNAVLSTSSFHMGNHSSFPVEYWTSKGEYYLKRAQHHFQKCMEEACILPTKTSKYKEILMIILSLSTAYVCFNLVGVVESLGREYLKLTLSKDDQRPIRPTPLLPHPSRKVHLHPRLQQIHSISKATHPPPLLRIHAHHGRNNKHH